MYRRLAQNTVVNIVNMGANILVGFALTPFFIHALGDETYGIWVLVSSLIVLRGFLGVFNLGIQSSLIKYVAEYDALGEQQKINEVTSAALIFYTLIGLILCLLIGGLAFFSLSTITSIFTIPPSQLNTAQNLLLYLAFQTLVDFPALALMGLLEGLNRFDITRGLNILRLIVFSALSIGLLLAGAGVYSLAIATFASEFIRALGHLYFIHRLVPAFRLTRAISARVMRQIAAFGSKAFIYGLTDTVYNQMDQLIIASLLTTTLLTDYDISHRLHKLVFSLTTMIGPFIVPAASALHARGQRQDLKLLFMRGTRYTAVLTAPLALITIVLAHPLTVTWIGAEYTHTVFTTQLFISYIMVWLLLRIGQNMLIGIDKLNVLLPIFGFSTVVNLIVSLYAAPRLGVMGVVLGTVTGNLLAAGLYLRAFKREMDVSPGEIAREVIFRVFPQALAGAGVSVLLRLLYEPATLFEVALNAGTGLLTFLVLFSLTGMPPAERQALLAMLGDVWRWLGKARRSPSSES